MCQSFNLTPRYAALSWGVPWNINACYTIVIFALLEMNKAVNALIENLTLSKRANICRGMKSKHTSYSRLPPPTPRTTERRGMTGPRPERTWGQRLRAWPLGSLCTEGKRAGALTSPSQSSCALELSLHHQKKTSWTSLDKFNHLLVRMHRWRG